MFHVKHPSSSLSSFYLDGAFTSSIFLSPYRAVFLSFLFHVEHSLNPKSLKKKLTITNFGFNFFSNINTDHFNLLHHQPSLPEMFHVKQSNYSPLAPLTPPSLTLLFFPTPASTPENISLLHSINYCASL